MPLAPFIAIGSKGTVIPSELESLQYPLQIGTNNHPWADDPRLSPDKRREREIVRLAGGWVSQNRKDFDLWPLDDAVSRGLIQVRHQSQWKDTDGKVHVGTAYFRSGWSAKDGQPLCLAVSSETWRLGHIEREPHRDRERNEGTVARLIFAGEARPVEDSVEWSIQEDQAVVADYLDMLRAELRGDKYNKAEHNRRLRTVIAARSRSSIEWKHRNISSVLLGLGFPYVAGYKPAHNRQQLLVEVIAAAIKDDPKLQELVAKLVELPAEAPISGDLLGMEEPPPTIEEEDVGGADFNTPAVRAAVKKNYLEIESRNRSLGRAGEELILRFEQERLRRAGEQALAKQVDHVANSKGDGLGYDIHSYENDGRDRFIEVKTTRFGPLTPFFVSRNEVRFSTERADLFHLYRLHSFSAIPKFFVLPGQIDRSCCLTPVQYSARPAPTS